MADKEYIERELATKILEEHMTKTAQSGNKLMKFVYLMAKDHAIDYLNIMPTADVVEVRHGEWVQDVYDKMMDIYRCSCCETSWSVIDNDMERFNYCPNCGAKMDGGEGE